MEASAINRHANRHFERAVNMRQSMVELKDQIKAARAAQRVHRIRGLHVLIDSTLNPALPDAPEVGRELHETRRLNNIARDQEHRVSSLERKVRSAVDKAHVLIGLAHRASGGHVYAKHQAEIVIQH